MFNESVQQFVILIIVEKTLHAVFIHNSAQHCPDQRQQYDFPDFPL